MDVDRIVVRFMADAGQYHRVHGEVLNSLAGFTASANRAAKGVSQSFSSALGGVAAGFKGLRDLMTDIQRMQQHTVGRNSNMAGLLNKALPAGSTSNWAPPGGMAGMMEAVARNAAKTVAAKMEQEAAAYARKAFYPTAVPANLLQTVARSAVYANSGYKSGPVPARIPLPVVPAPDPVPFIRQTMQKTVRDMTQGMRRPTYTSFDLGTGAADPFVGFSKMLSDFSAKAGMELRQTYSKIRVLSAEQMKAAFPEAPAGVVPKGAFNRATREIFLNKDALNSRAKVMETLAHELGHAADLFKGGGSYASSVSGSLANAVGSDNGRRKLQGLLGKGHQFAPGMAGYIASPNEGFARAFADLMTGRGGGGVRQALTGVGGGGSSGGSGASFNLGGAGGEGPGALRGVMNGMIGVVRGGFQTVTGIVGMALSVIGAAAKVGAVSLIGLGVATGAAGYAAIKLASDYQQAAIALEVMTGSAETGKKLLDDITQMAVETPFTSPQLIDSAKQLKAFGVDTGQIIPTLRALGDVSAGTGTKMERIVLAFGQVRVMGRLMGPELRQFTDAGIPIIDALAKVAGVSTQAIKGMVENGQISAAMVTQAFNQMTQAGGLFAGLMERQSKTVAGRWSTLSDNIGIAARNVGLAFFKGFDLTGLLEQWNSVAMGFIKSADDLEPFFKRVRGWFDSIENGVSAVATVLFGQLLNGLKQLEGADFQNGLDRFVDSMVYGFGTMVDSAKTFLNTLASILEAMGDIAVKMGLLGDGGVFKQNRKNGDSVLGAGAKSLAAGAVEISSELGGVGKFVNQPALLKYLGVKDPTGNPFDGAANRIRAMTAAMGDNTGQKMSEEYRRLRENDILRRTQAEGQRAFNVLSPNTVGSMARLNAQYPNLGLGMDVNPDHSSKAVGLSNKIKGDFLQFEGMGGKAGALGAFREQMKLIKEAGTAIPGNGEFKGREALLNAQQMDFGRLAVFRTLQQQMGKGGEQGRTADAAMYGSQSAQDAVAKAMTRTGSVQEEALATLREALMVAKEEAKQAEEIKKLLEKIEAKPGAFFGDI